MLITIIEPAILPESFRNIRVSLDSLIIDMQPEFRNWFLVSRWSVSLRIEARSKNLRRETAVPRVQSSLPYAVRETPRKTVIRDSNILRIPLARIFFCAGDPRTCAVGNARRIVPQAIRSAEFNWFHHSTRNGTASVPYKASRFSPSQTSPSACGCCPLRRGILEATHYE